MTYIVQDQQVLTNILNLARAAAAGTSGASKPWVPVYGAILEAITETVSTEVATYSVPASPEIETVWYWVKGAMTVVHSASIYEIIPLLSIC